MSFLRKITTRYNVAIATADSFILRPKGWEAISEEAVEWFNKHKKSDHLYRGMTNKEYAATIGAHKPLQSKGLHSFAHEGTCFSDDPADAESYVNYGRDDPRKTGIPNYLIEIKKSDNIVRDRDGYYKTKDSIELKQVTNVWIMQDKDGDIVISSFKKPI